MAASIATAKALDSSARRVASESCRRCPSAPGICHGISGIGGSRGTPATMVSPIVVWKRLAMVAT
jgi:hypothetical protein